MRLLLEALGSSRPRWSLLLSSLPQLLHIFGHGGLPLSPRNDVLVILGEGAPGHCLDLLDPLLGTAVPLSRLAVSPGACSTSLPCVSGTAFVVSLRELAMSWTNPAPFSTILSLRLTSLLRRPSFPCF